MVCEKADLFGWRSSKMEEARENNNPNIFNQAKKYILSDGAM